MGKAAARPILIYLMFVFQDLGEKVPRLICFSVWSAPPWVFPLLWLKPIEASAFVLMCERLRIPALNLRVQRSLTIQVEASESACRHGHEGDAHLYVVVNKLETLGGATVDSILPLTWLPSFRAFKCSLVPGQGEESGRLETTKLSPDSASATASSPNDSSIEAAIWNLCVPRHTPVNNGQWPENGLV